MINNYLERQIKENFPYQPTLEQEIAVKSLSEFLLSTLADEVFILRGYAGTGKTSLVGALVKTMDQTQENEDQSVDTLPLLRIGNKTPMEGVTETKFGAETKGWTI